MKKVVSKPQRFLITILRLAIGWHFIYEGMVKLIAENWTSAGYLSNSMGFLSGFYQWMASSPAMIKVIDLMNIYGLILIGLGLFFGIMIRFAAYSGVLLLTLYYFAYPPFGDTALYWPEGNLFIVNKVLIEAFVLLFIAVYKEKGYNIGALIAVLFKSKKTIVNSDEHVYHPSRREALKNLASVPVLGIMGWGAVNNYDAYSVDVFSGATIQAENFSLSDLKGELPKGKIGDHEISRLVMGGNLIHGGTHGRDLIYTNSLSKAYNTEKKIYETLILAEKAGINSINIGWPSIPVMAKYKKVFESKIKVICQVGHDFRGDNHFDDINNAIDSGADIIQIIGHSCDRLVMEERVELIGRMLEKIRGQGYTAGLGAHAVQSFQICKAKGVIPDYYMVTMHHDNYWSAHPYENRKAFEIEMGRNMKHGTWHDNMWCQFPEKTIDFVENVDLPVMGFKVLAAGAIQPADGFNWAFKHGADFICVGMFDFQVVSNINVCLETLSNLHDRKRMWYA